MRSPAFPGALALVILSATIAAAAKGGPTPFQVKWLEQNAIPFKTVEARHGFEDLEPLRDMIGEARIVALGECTHGTREVFQMKHRLTEFLATEMGFTLFSIEASSPEAFAVNDYVARGEGDPRELIGGMYFWTWNTEEVLDMVQWMRGFNRAGEGRIEFTGFDMQTPDVAMEIVQGFLGEADPERAERVSTEYERIKNAAERTSPFGVVTFTFPVDEARGKSVRYRGSIKTEGLVGGWAGLWWRVDAGDRRGIAFDNMESRGPEGTTDWEEYTIKLDVAEEATNIHFGLVMPGHGSAWFDGLTIELDGVPYEGDSLDLDFEGSHINGYHSNDAGYLADFDTQEVHSGKQSLKIESRKVKEIATLDATAAAQIAGEIYSELSALRGSFLETRPARDVDWAIHNARIIDQCMRMRGGGGTLVRDESMAENIAWILEQNPEAKIILWAHNFHVSRKEGAMGSHLHEKFGDDYLPVAFAAREGTYYAKGGETLDGNVLQEPPPGSIESFFVATGKPRLILDLRSADADSGDCDWLSESRPFRSIGAIATENQFNPTKVIDDYDVLIYLEKTTAARQLDTPPRRRD